jgi:diketogulonate reductase-like aldo/keto reductase
LYFLHWPDPKVDFAESVGALEELRIEGKIERVGVSNVTAELLEIAQATTRLSAIQNCYSPFETRDRQLMRECASRGILYFAYSPLGGGRSLPRSAELPRTAEHALQLGVSVERIILAWELSIATSVVAISGSSRPSTVVDAAAAGELNLDQETLAAIEADVQDLS